MFPPASRFPLPLLAVLLLCLAGMAQAARFSSVVIDAGHGGKDKGAFWGGVRESHLTLQVAQRLERLLKNKGVKTAMTRRSDVFVSLGSRVGIANRHASALLVSIHFNACRSRSYRGVETFYGGAASRAIAQAVQSRLAARLKTNNRGVKLRDYKVLRETKGPAVLVECGFLSHSGERARCKTGAYQQTAAQAICDGVMAVR
ncbi:N-acetylmuramoyl-L-alanine amidase [Luteolibacter sp. Populi]|uniref:N-acetylmuramoyl-L-alanine amidase family protein n=1 Tax=Luteolibacter sp. Populi TaxID=3230487 RepID=UPI003465FCA2